MANKKRDRNGYRKELGRYRLNRADIIVIEKILREYADVYEISRATKYGKPNTPPSGRKHMPRVFADMHIKVGRYQPFTVGLGWNELTISQAGVEYIYDADSVRFLPKFIKGTRYLEIACRPGIVVTFTPLRTTIYAQTHYATSGELMAMKKTVTGIENYLSELPQSWMNRCTLLEK